MCSTVRMMNLEGKCKGTIVACYQVEVQHSFCRTVEDPKTVVRMGTPTYEAWVLIAWYCALQAPRCTSEGNQNCVDTACSARTQSVLGSRGEQEIFKSLFFLMCLP